MKTSEFEYDLPSELIAQTPIEPRDASRLLVLHRATGNIEHRLFRDIGDYLRPGDLLVANDTKVIPARLFGHKTPTGGKVELLLLRRKDERRWEALVRGRKIRAGTEIRISKNPEERGETQKSSDEPGNAESRIITGQVIAELESGKRVIEFDTPLEPLLDKVGVVPLPPYIHAPLADPNRYQTIYARQPGSSAAPTAGLHFTPELMLRLRRRGIEFAYVTLDIGLDTFRPVHEENVEDHRMHTEICQLSPEVAVQINQARLEGRRIVAIGTTAVRVLETAARAASRANDKACAWQTVVPFEGPTDLFIYPGFRFRVVDALITNFHLPRSTLLLLVSAFAGRELILHAYQEAIARRYRFYSFGDAMLII